MLKTTKQSYNTFEKVTKVHHPLENANLLSKLFLFWVVPLVRRGSDIELKDVWDFQDANTCSVNTVLFQKAYKETKSVVWSFLRVYGIQYALMGLFGLILRLMELVAPIVLNKVVQNSDDQTTMYCWIGLLFISMSCHAFVMAHCFMLEDTTGLRFQSGLKGLLFNKLLSHSLMSQNAPELSNIVSADMDTIHWGLISSLDVWVLPVQILSITYLLYNEIGLAVFAGIGVIVLSLLAGGYISFLQSIAYDNVSTARDNRMKSIKETFGAILNVKLQAWEPQLLAKLVALRTTELKYVWQLMRAGAIGIFCMYASPLCVSMTSFAVYTLILGGSLTPAKIFTSLALFRMLQSPLSQIPENFTAIVEARTALRRIDEYLIQDDKPPSPPRGDLKPNVAIAINNADFSWDNATAHLSSISIEIQKGDLVVVHGKVGSGKSSLCMAMLGEMYTMKGTMGVSGSVCYCSQEPWIQQMSLRENILFGQPFDQEKYERVIHACGLVADFNSLQSGDQTIASSKGSNLSGGQKARIGLARAVYSDADIIILDAPLAAIDAVVQNQIMAECIEKLLAHKTVVLVTHNPDIISSERINQAIHLDGGMIQSIELRKPSTLAISSNGTKSPAMIASAATLHSYNAPQRTNSTESDDDEHREVGRVSGRVFWQFLAACGGVSTVVFVLLCQLMWQVFQVSSDFWLTQWTSNASHDNTIYYLSIYCGLCLASVTMVLARTLTVSLSGLKASRYLFESMTTSLLAAPMTFFDGTPSGRIINRFSNDMASIDTRLPFSFGSITAEMTLIIASLSTTIIVVRWSGLLMIPILIAYLKLTQLYLQPSRVLSRFQKTTASPVLSYLEEIEQGFVSVRAFGESYLKTQVLRNAHNIDTNHRVEYCVMVVGLWFEMMIELQGTLVVVGVAFCLVYFRSYLSAGMVGLAFNYVLVANNHFAQIVQCWSRLELGMVAPERVMEFCDLESEVVSTTNNQNSWTLAKGSIDFENVHFQYKPTSELVLRGLSFSIKAGEKIGIVGRTGAGKSSLTMVLFRLYSLTSGRILIDGQDTSALELQQLRKQLSIIPQSPILFKGTLREFLDPFDSYDDDDLWVALKKAGMATMVSSLPDKLQAEVAERGINWSVGERQMLCLARALLVKAHIVVLDEATAAIDHATDVLLQKVISEEFKSATVLTIAHRLHTIASSDRVLVMDSGMLVEFDSPRALVQAKGSFYKLAKEAGILEELF